MKDCNKLQSFFYRMLDQPKSLKFFHYTPITNVQVRKNDPMTSDQFGLERKKSFKVKVRNRMIYTVDIFYYEDFAFVKFHPNKFEASEDRYKMVGLNLTIEEKRGLLNTCCKIVANEFKKDENKTFAFIGQWYGKDNKKRRKVTIRFSLYKKVVTTFFEPKKYAQISIDSINFFCLSTLSEKRLETNIQKLTGILYENQDTMLDFMTEATKDEIFGVQTSSN